MADDPPVVTLGRPTTYTPELAERVLEIYSTQTSGTVLDACERAGTDWRTVRRWMDARPEFAQAFAQARRDKAEVVAGQAGSIIDAVDPDSTFGSARVSKAREQSGYRRWLAGCLDRETYGERPAVAIQVNTVGVAFSRLAAPTASDDE